MVLPETKREAKMQVMIEFWGGTNTNFSPKRTAMWRQNSCKTPPTQFFMGELRLRCKCMSIVLHSTVCVSESSPLVDKWLSNCSQDPPDFCGKPIKIQAYTVTSKTKQYIFVALETPPS
jgi:hypothetical protein